MEYINFIIYATGLAGIIALILSFVAILFLYEQDEPAEEPELIDATPYEEEDFRL